MIIIDILGGGTEQNLELHLYSNNHKATSKYDKDGNFQIKVEEHHMNNKSKIIRMPFIRGLYIYFSENVTDSENKRKITLNLLDVIVVIIYMLDKFYLKISLMDYVYVLFICFYFILALVHKNMVELHGAEHMLTNYYDKNHKANLSDINEIKKYSIIHERCGSNFYGINLAILLLLKIFINDFIVRFIIMQSLSYEIATMKKNNIVYYLIYPLLAFGMLTQKLFFVKQPKDKDVEQAIRTVQELEKYENE